MSAYKEIFEIIAKRQMGIIGKVKTEEVFREAGVELNGDGLFLEDLATFDNLELLLKRLKTKYGPVTIMGCKIAVVKKAREQNLKLPDILK